ncbi:hypothetical protein T4A_1075 [Trichinella pseudospiralis]|uniref:Uncharacterized protein n=1 Tax=Trichinella pseudospiralis TaxID=6337 RepID=A0A0V1FDW6_TRIPS|nr:hypothetical protein T4A_1075 [Trichinella pseudospiralis]KRY84249.1 hypothetical protein T4D_2785 [Trichinella pseudospiralis]
MKNFFDYTEGFADYRILHILLHSSSYKQNYNTRHLTLIKHLFNVFQSLSTILLNQAILQHVVE